MYPLVELHAHLNGCVRYSTLRELANEEVGRVGVFTVPERGSGVGSGGAEAERTLAECFEVFDWIYRVVDRRSAVARVVREAVADFAADGVAYLELRTTPRALADATAATAAGAREEYAQLVARELRSSASQHGMVARLLLSINRGGDSAAEAMATVDAAARLADGGSGVVVGVDLCGNPARGDFATYVPALQRARAAGLRVTLHLGELDRPREVAEMLDFGPDRVGHACFLDAAAWARVRAGRVPLEACVTSNLRTASVASANTHHALELVRAGHPVAICTDDPGVFGRSAREEHELVRAALGYDGRQMAALGARVLAEGCFLSTRDQDVRAALIRRFRAIADGER